MGNKDFLLEKRLFNLDPQLHKKFTDGVFVVQNMLNNYLVHFPEYTDHSASHSVTVIEFCNELIGKKQVNQLNADEIFVLLMACYLHDVGMGVNENDFNEFSKKMDFGDYFESHDRRDKIRIIRDFHQEFSAQFIYKYAPLFEFPSEEYTFAIAQAARGHRKVDLFNQEEFPDKLVLSNGNTICVPYLAAVLRLADEIDVAADRNLGFFYDQSTIWDKKQIFEFAKHNAVRQLKISKDSFTLTVDDSDEEVYNAIIALISKMKDTLDYCVSVVQERTSFEITQKKIIINKDRTR